MIFEVHSKSSESFRSWSKVFQRFLKLASSLPKVSEVYSKTSEDFRSWPEVLRRCLSNVPDVGPKSFECSRIEVNTNRGATKLTVLISYVQHNVFSLRIENGRRMIIIIVTQLIFPNSLHNFGKTSNRESILFASVKWFHFQKSLIIKFNSLALVELYLE